MKKVVTGDGSITFHNEQYDEAYHSVTGAVEEAFKKFVEPTHITNLAELGMVSILDVCFGLGYNSAAAIDKIMEVNPECKIIIVGLEKDEKILRKIPGLSPQIKSYEIIKDMVKNNYSHENKNIRVNLLVCDALDAVKR